MFRQRKHNGYASPIAILSGLVLLILTSGIFADGLTPDIPQVPESKATHCVEPTEIMRKNHMEFILHQRDKTVHSGIRTTKYSLKQCVNCHINPTADGEYPRYTLKNGDLNKDHFCASCHTYAAVHIDCFQCHRDTPSEASIKASAMVEPDSEYETGKLTINDMDLTAKTVANQKRYR